jgi:uncharacterized protein (TIGR00290 family)
MGSGKKVTISWSGGKDSAFALYKTLASGEYDVVSLHTIINRQTRRVGLHGVHENLIEMQAQAIGIPLIRLYLESSESSESFEVLTRSFYTQCVREKITGVVFGDIFLEDLKAYRESLIRDFGLDGIFPLWQMEPSKLIADFINLGFQTVICSADASFFGKKHLGQQITHSFIESLPENVDPCGERGEYHTFVCAGPIFKRQVPVANGDVVLRWYDYQTKSEDGTNVKQRSAFWFQELFRGTDS